MNTPTRSHINFLFDDLWPEMERSAYHRDRCIANIHEIVEAFESHPDDPDAVLQNLLAIDGIGLVIATGLLFCSNAERYVPFDKYSMGYALELRIFATQRITDGTYGDKSEAVVRYLAANSRPGGIIGFVRAASRTRFPFSPE